MEPQPQSRPSGRKNAWGRWSLAVLSTNRRQFSIVDCSAFETMHRLGTEAAFPFDSHFRAGGFHTLP